MDNDGKRQHLLIYSHHFQSSLQVSGQGGTITPPIYQRKTTTAADRWTREDANLLGLSRSPKVWIHWFSPCGLRPLDTFTQGVTVWPRGWVNIMFHTSEAFFCIGPSMRREKKKKNMFVSLVREMWWSPPMTFCFFLLETDSSKLLLQINTWSALDCR